jgi:gas vesicle protein
MDRNQLEQLGDELRGIGHRRRELAEQIFQEVQEGDNQASKDLYQELSHISDQAIDIMTRQKEMFDQEVQRL